jgi:hypothetical protein
MLNHSTSPKRLMSPFEEAQNTPKGLIEPLRTDPNNFNDIPPKRLKPRCGPLRARTRSTGCAERGAK